MRKLVLQKISLLTLAMLLTVAYISCKKDSCAGVICQNGGTCSGGSCKCPDGYTGSDCGSVAITYVTYKNNTCTPVTITANGKTSVIPVHGSITYTGQFTTYVTGFASTQGALDQDSTVVGSVMTWTIGQPFPISDTTFIPFNVSSDYYFLKLQDIDPVYSVQDLYVNGGIEFIGFANDRIVHDVGYFSSFMQVGLYIQSGSSAYWSITPTLPSTENQFYIAVIP